MTKRNVMIALAFSVCLAGPSASWAAGGEIAAMGGGITMDGGAGTHPLVGVTAGYRFSDSFQLFGEFGYTQLLSATEQASQGSVTASGTGSLNQTSFGGGVDYSFGSSKKLVPYVLTSLGVAHYSVSVSGTANNGSQNSSINATVGVTNALYATFGGGVRYFIGRNWGIRTEARYQRYSSSLFQANAVTYTGGLFYQFGK